LGYAIAFHVLVGHGPFEIFTDSFIKVIMLNIVLYLSTKLPCSGDDDVDGRVRLHAELRGPAHAPGGQAGLPGIRHRHVRRAYEPRLGIGRFR